MGSVICYLPVGSCGSLAGEKAEAMVMPPAGCPQCPCSSGHFPYDHSLLYHLDISGQLQGALGSCGGAVSGTWVSSAGGCSAENTSLGMFLSDSLQATQHCKELGSHVHWAAEYTYLCLSQRLLTPLRLLTHNPLFFVGDLGQFMQPAFQGMHFGKSEA